MWARIVISSLLCRFVKENKVKLPWSTPFDEVLLSMLDPNPKTRIPLKTCQQIFWGYRNELKNKK